MIQALKLIDEMRSLRTKHLPGEHNQQSHAGEDGPGTTAKTRSVTWNGKTQELELGKSYSLSGVPKEAFSTLLKPGDTVRFRNRKYDRVDKGEFEKVRKTKLSVKFDLGGEFGKVSAIVDMDDVESFVPR